MFYLGRYAEISVTVQLVYWCFRGEGLAFYGFTGGFGGRDTSLFTHSDIVINVNMGFDNVHIF
jgi:hypothetical protein